MANSESELKFELEQADYDRLLGSLLELGLPRIFFNSYFTTAPPSERRDWVLRLRFAESQAGGELTLKVGHEREPGMFCSQEYTAMVGSRDPSAWEASEPVRVLRREISQASLSHQGQSRNERRVVRSPFGPVHRWEVDRTELPDGSVVYELEIEWPVGETPDEEEIAGCRERLERWFEQTGLSPLTPSRKTKYGRFLDALRARS